MLGLFLGRLFLRRLEALHVPQRDALPQTVNGELQLLLQTVIAIDLLDLREFGLKQRPGLIRFRAFLGSPVGVDQLGVFVEVVPIFTVRSDL